MICFDDYERMSSDVRREDLLGMINTLIENYRKKVIVIANQEEVLPDKSSENIATDKGEKYKEKVFEKTVGYTPEIADVFFQMVNEKDDEVFKKFMNETPLVRQTLNITHKANFEKTFRSLSTDLSNLRSLKYAINQFEVIFRELLTIDKAILEEKAILGNIWCFVLAIFVESRLNRISYKERMRIDNYDSSIAKAAEMMRFMKKDKDATEFTDVTDPLVYGRFFEFTYFIRHYERLHYNDNIFNFLTNGDKLDTQAIISDWKNLFYPKEYRPSMALFHRFMTDSIGFTDEEFPEKLSELLTYAEKGDFDSLRNFINAAFMLVKYREYFGKTEKQIKDAIKKGMGIHVETLPKTDTYFGPQKIRRSQDSEQSIVKDMYDYADELVRLKYEADIREDTSALEALFIENIDEFVEKVAPSQKDNNPHFHHIPFLHNFSNETVKYHLNDMTVAKARLFDEFIQQRYLDGRSNDILKDEKSFLISLKANLEEMDLTRKVLSIGYINGNLIPTINKAISALDRNIAN
ncbi:P-loop NTPase fold protein [Alistipes sp.]|uniref:P-loop NTPase fold protein n=1 Tax=Alistipes sp. TaxID=1872444 RepID=UPI003AB245F8